MRRRSRRRRRDAEVTHPRLLGSSTASTGSVGSASPAATGADVSHQFLFPHFRAKDLTTGDRKSGEYGRRALEEGIVRK